MATIIIFYVLLIGLLIFLQWKVVLLRSGKIEIQTIHKDKARKIKVLKQIIRYLSHRLKDWLKNGFIKFASWRIRTRARVNYFIETKLPGLYIILTKRPDVEEHHTKNLFWRGVIEYKYKIQRLKAQILEEEVQKINEKMNQSNTPPEMPTEIPETITNLETEIPNTPIDDLDLKSAVVVPENIEPVIEKKKRLSIVKRVVKKVKKVKKTI